MAFNNIDAGQLQLGSILQIAFSKGVRTQISQDFRDFEMVRRAKISSSAPRQINFYFQNGLLPSNTQWRNPGTSNRSFPRAFQPATAEYSAKLKEANASIELEYNLYERAKATPEKYAEPLQMILSAAMTSTKREMARALYKDGTGVIAQVAAGANAAAKPASNQVVFTLDSSDTSRGHVGDMEYDEHYVLVTGAGNLAGDAPLTGEFDTDAAVNVALWQCVDKDRALGKVTMRALNVDFTPKAAPIAVTQQPTVALYFYKYDQPTRPALASVSDYGTASETLAGLESLAANDGRVIHGITMSGVTGASEFNATAALDLSDFNKAMDKVKVEVGQDRYKWKQAICSPEAQSALIESREADKRFINWDEKDGTGMGSKKFGIQHRNDQIELVDSEYCHPKRLWILPETKGGEKVIEMHGSDFTTVKEPNGGGDFRLKVEGGAYVNSVVSYMQSVCVLICKHPKSIVKIRNFT